MRSVIIKNDGNGKFSSQPLPNAAQVSTVFGMLLEDINLDGNLDLILCGNDYGTDVYVGRYDASNGLVLLGDGKGNFSPLSILQSGFFIPGNSKALVKLMNSKKECLVIATQNRELIKAFIQKEELLEFRQIRVKFTVRSYLKMGRREKKKYIMAQGTYLNLVDLSMSTTKFSDWNFMILKAIKES
jgi:hypothetical protein